MADELALPSVLEWDVPEVVDMDGEVAVRLVDSFRWGRALTSPRRLRPHVGPSAIPNGLQLILDAG